MADNSRSGFSSEGGIGTALFWPLVSNIRGDVWFRGGTGLSEVVASAAAGEALDEFPALQCLGELIFEVCGDHYRHRDKHLQNKTPPKRGSVVSA